MIGLLIAAHGNLGESLIQCAIHVLGKRPEALEALDLMSFDDTDSMLRAADHHIEHLDTGEGVLILTDLYGSTPCNTVCKLLRPGRVEAVTGVNVPMLLKVLTYRGEQLRLLADRAAEGAREGVFHIRFDRCDA
jgi:PTS system ascorbate-specific IIA component